MFLKISQNSQENTYARVSPVSSSLRPAILLKKRLWHRCFPVNFVKFLITPFLQNTSRRLLLWFTKMMYDVIITTAQLHSTMLELVLCAGSNPAHGMSEIGDGEDLVPAVNKVNRLSSVNHTKETIHHYHQLVVLTVLKISDLYVE